MELIYDLYVNAQESAAFMVGFAMGKRAEPMYFDSNRGILRTRRGAQRLHDGGAR